MTFLNGAILAALTLGLLPILIHLLNRQRFKNVDFPTLRFLHELQRQKMRQVKIRQLLLLILRTLAVLFLVLALARPVLKSSAGLLPGAGARTTAVLVLDRSASMQTETADGSRFRRMQTRAQEVLELLNDGDDVQIVWADLTPSVFPEQPTSQIRLVREAVGAAEPAMHGGDLVDAVRRARQTLGESQNLHKEVYLISDFSISAWPEEMPLEPLLPSDTRLYLLSTDGERIRNVGITEAAVSSRIITPGRPVEVSFTVRNSGREPVSDQIVSVYLTERRVAQTRVSLAAGESKPLRLKFTPQEPGDHVGHVRVEDADDLAADDQRHFVLRVPSRLRVAVAGSPGAARDLTVLALNPANDPDGFVDAYALTPAHLEGEDWSVFDAIVLADAAGFSSGFPSRLRDYVEDGRGVFVMMGSQADLRAYDTWLPTLGLPAPADVWQGSAPARWSNVDLAHPLFEGLFEEKPANISPDIQRLVRTPSLATAIEIISTSSGLPFLLEAKVGRGRALLMTGSPDPQWSTLYRAGIFPPLMVSGVAYLSGVGTSGAEFQFVAGMPATVTFPGTPGEDRHELKGTATSIVPALESARSGYVLRFPGLNQTGSYDLWKGSRRLTPVVVNVPGEESNLQPAPEAGYSSLLGGQLKTLDQQDNIKSAVLESRHGRELWKLCLIIALALLLAEMLIGRVGKREVAMAA